MALILQQLWANKQIIAEIFGLLVVGILAWYFLIHNPAVIDGLEKDKAELARQVKAGNDAVHLLDDINKGKVAINAQVFQNISTIRAAVVPRRAVIIRGGVQLPAIMY